MKKFREYKVNYRKNSSLFCFFIFKNVLYLYYQLKLTYFFFWSIYMVTAKSILKEVVSAFEGVRSYSGHFTNGQECVGIATDDETMLQLRIIESCLRLVADKLTSKEITAIELPELLSCIYSTIRNSGVRRDAMGLDTIVYYVNWPASEWLND